MERPAVVDYPAGAQMPARVIDDLEFVWMLRGQALVTHDGGELPLRPGLLLLVPPGVRHGFVWDQTRGSRHGYVHFGPGLEHDAASTELLIRPMTANDPLAGLCAFLLWLGRSEADSWRQPADGTLELLLRLFLHGPLPEPDGTRLAAPLSAAIGHLRREWAHHPLRRVDVGQLAAAAHVSRGYLNRLFRAGFGLSAATALEHARCSRAEMLLTHTDSSVEAIAHQCGFADASHFSHRFTAIRGVSPRAYRAAGIQSPSVLDHPGVRHLTHLVWA
jgi:AraC-like DNA-binding protein